MRWQNERKMSQDSVAAILADDAIVRSFNPLNLVLTDRCLDLVLLFQPAGMTELKSIEYELSRKLHAVIRPKRG
jgi:hypothetical protein